MVASTTAVLLFSSNVKIETKAPSQQPHKLTTIFVETLYANTSLVHGFFLPLVNVSFSLSSTP